jgi:hypothetical protein
MGMPRKDEHEICPELLQLRPSRTIEPERTFFSKVAHQTSHTQLHCVKICNTSNHRHRRHLEKKNVLHPVQQHLSQQEIQRRCLSVQAFSSTNNDMLKIATLVQQIMTELGETVSEKDKILVITKMVFNETK